MGGLVGWLGELVIDWLIDSLIGWLVGGWVGWLVAVRIVRRGNGRKQQTLGFSTKVFVQVIGG